MDYATDCAFLHNFLLLENHEGARAFYEDDGRVLDLDANNDLNRPAGQV